MTTQLIQTEMNNSIAQGLDQLNNLNQQVFDYWYSELFDENDDPIMEMWTDKTLNEIEKDVMYNSFAD
jgi:tRNA U34 5-methylaminomethyl-2-thiouridine-forming methyltransferase MnmC